MFTIQFLKQRTDLRFIQEPFGYSSSKATEIYIHVSNQHIKKIENPIN